MYINNYTKLKNRDKKFYSFGNINFSQSGLSYGLLKTVSVVLAVFNIFGIIYCIGTNKFWYNPLLFIESSTVGYFWTVFIFVPIAIGTFLYNYRIQQYRLIEYILMQLKPKNPIDFQGKRVKIHGYKVDALVFSLYDNKL